MAHKKHFAVVKPGVTHLKPGVSYLFLADDPASRSTKPNKKHLTILKRGVNAWNKWREKNDPIWPDLVGVDLREANLEGANFSKTNLTDAFLAEANLTGANFMYADLTRTNLVAANLTKANLSVTYLNGAYLFGADLTEAHLTRSEISGADFSQANLSGADLVGATLIGSNLSAADLTEANLSGADLRETLLVGANLERTNLTDCSVYGISVWNVQGEPKEQLHLNISPLGEPTITVDNLEVAQFIYLLLNNRKIRGVIDTLTTKAVLILGRFTDERKKILDAIRDELRKRDYLPILFDFEPSDNRDLTETVTTLARLSRFIIADLTDPRSIPQELASIVPDLPSVPVQPLLLSSQREYGMFEHFTRYPWVLPIQRYDSQDTLIASLGNKVIAPAEQKAKELEKR